MSRDNLGAARCVSIKEPCRTWTKDTYALKLLFFHAIFRIALPSGVTPIDILIRAHHFCSILFGPFVKRFRNYGFLNKCRFLALLLEKLKIITGANNCVD